MVSGLFFVCLLDSSTRPNAVVELFLILPLALGKRRTGASRADFRASVVGVGSLNSGTAIRRSKTAITVHHRYLCVAGRCGIELKSISREGGYLQTGEIGSGVTSLEIQVSIRLIL
jgi:hypothetical protein